MLTTTYWHLLFSLLQTKQVDQSFCDSRHLQYVYIDQPRSIVAYHRSPFISNSERILKIGTVY